MGKINKHETYRFRNNKYMLIKMEKTELGFQCEVGIGQTDLLNLCFRNSSNVWDNNEGHNYSFDIIKKEVTLTKKVENNLPAKKLSKTYLWGKKFKILFYKVITYVPKLFGNSYKRKEKNEAI